MTTATFSAPETVTISGEVALEALALLNAYADVAADFRVDGESDPFFVIEDSVWQALVTELGYDREKDLDDHPWYLAAEARSRVLADEIRSHYDGHALGAIAAVKAAHNIAAVKDRLEYVRAA